MSRTSVKIEGLDDLAKDLQRFGEDLDGYLVPKIERAKELLFVNTVANVPYKTGELYRSIKMSPTSKKDGRIYVGVYSDCFYAPFVELGHKVSYKDRTTGKTVKTEEFVKASRFMRCAAAKSKKPVSQMLTDGVDEAIKALGDKK